VFSNSGSRDANYVAQQSISNITPNNINLDFLDKLSIFLKVSSGTYTLSKTI
jgi:hypothetical protein